MNMAREQYTVGLDIGTQNIRVVQAKWDEDAQNLSIIGAVTVPAFGMRKGVIVDIEETVSSISNALEKLERMTGVAVTSAVVSVGGTHIQAVESRGVIAVSRADGEITENDIVRVIDASEAISIPPNREVLHVIPRTFTLDGQTGIKDPLGMSGIRLEVDTTIIHAGLPFIKNLNRAVTQSGLDVESLVLAPLAASEACLSKRQKELGVALIDLGAGTTNIAVFEENNLLHTAVLPIGGMHITNDVAIGLRCTIDTAEKVKLLFGHASSKDVAKGQEIDLATIDEQEQDRVSKSEVVEIVEARLEEIFEHANRELKKINRDGKLPAGVVLSGGGSNLPGLVDFVKREMRLPAQIGVVNVNSVIDQVSDPVFATAVGLVLWGGKTASSSGSSMPASVGRLLENQNVLKLKKWFKSFLP